MLDRLTESYVSDIVSNPSVCALQFHWWLFVAEKYLRCLLVLTSALLELLCNNDTGWLVGWHFQHK